MDDLRFDSLAKALAASANRRGVFAGLVAGFATALGLAGGPLSVIAKKKKKKKCKGSQKKCGGKCIPKSRCCNNGDCKGGAKCKGGKCKCPSGTKDCAGKCIPVADCCTNADCGDCESCQNGTCQTGCQSGQTCQSGQCVCTEASCVDGCCDGDTCLADFKTCDDACIPVDDCCTNADCTDPETPVCVEGECVCGAAGDQCEINDGCCSGVCNCGDPTGWATHPDAGVCQAVSFEQGFEENLDSWYDFANDPPADENETFPPTDNVIERVATGTNGIPAKSGGFFAKVKESDAYAGDLTPLSTIGGFSDVFPAGGFDTSLDIYLDPPTTSNGEFFSYTVALNQTGCEHIQDFVFHAGKTADTFCVSVNTGASSNTNPCAAGSEPVTITEAGWYRFRHAYTQDGGQTDVTLALIDPDGDTVRTWERTVTQPGVVGGNRYAWFPVNTFNFVAIDNLRRNPL